MTGELMASGKIVAVIRFAAYRTGTVAGRRLGPTSDVLFGTSVVPPTGR